MGNQSDGVWHKAEFNWKPVEELLLKFRYL